LIGNDASKFYRPDKFIAKPAKQTLIVFAGKIGLALNVLTIYKSYAKMNVNHFLFLVIDYQKE
jgi:hypothetical protein